MIAQNPQPFMAKYTPKPKTVQEHLDNVHFQLENVDGYLLMEDGLRGAQIQTQCLADAVSELIISLRRVEEQSKKAGGAK